MVKYDDLKWWQRAALAALLVFVLTVDGCEAMPTTRTCGSDRDCAEQHGTTGEPR